MEDIDERPPLLVSRVELDALYTKLLELNALVASILSSVTTEDKIADATNSSGTDEILLSQPAPTTTPKGSYANALRTMKQQQRQPVVPPAPLPPSQRFGTTVSEKGSDESAAEPFIIRILANLREPVKSEVVRSCLHRSGLVLPSGGKITKQLVNRTLYRMADAGLINRAQRQNKDTLWSV